MSTINSYLPSLGPKIIVNQSKLGNAERTEDQNCPITLTFSPEKPVNQSKYTPTKKS